MSKVQQGLRKWSDRPEYRDIRSPCDHQSSMLVASLPEMRRAKDPFPAYDFHHSLKEGIKSGINGNMLPAIHVIAERAGYSCQMTDAHKASKKS
jgi:hypothetical protein